MIKKRERDLTLSAFCFYHVQMLVKRGTGYINQKAGLFSNFKVLMKASYAISKEKNTGSLRDCIPIITVHVNGGIFLCDATYRGQALMCFQGCQ